MPYQRRGYIRNPCYSQGPMRIPCQIRKYNEMFISVRGHIKIDYMFGNELGSWLKARIYEKSFSQTWTHRDSW